MPNKANGLPLAVAFFVFSIVAIAHLLRILYHTEITVSGHILPMSVSYGGFFISLLLAVWMFKSIR